MNVELELRSRELALQEKKLELEQRRFEMEKEERAAQAKLTLALIEKLLK